MSVRGPAVLLYDGYGNPLAARDGYAVTADIPGLLAMGTDDAGAAHRLRLQGDRALVTTSQGHPSDPTNIVIGYAEQGAGDDPADLLVDGDPTPIDFTFDADPVYDLFIQSVGFVLVAREIAFGGDRFANVSILDNGVQILIDVGTPTEIFNIRVNEDFIHFASPGGFGYDVASSDVVRSQYSMGGALKLSAGSTDKVIIRIRDDLGGAVASYFKCLVKAYKEG